MNIMISLMIMQGGEVEVQKEGGVEVVRGGREMIISLKVGEAGVRKEGTVVMITEMVGGEGAGAEVMRGGVVLIGGEVWNILVKLGGGAEVWTGMKIRTVMYIGEAGAGIIMIIVKVVNIEMIGGEGAEVVRGGRVMEVRGA